ncbi:hypothetical protein G3I56_29615 [Streptomyces sp. SID12488]|nr:hypothetical protein [Streptomyces sp. SID12488]
MLTIVIIAVMVIAAVIFFVVGRGRFRAGEGRGMKRRFGPEYDRAVADHDGDTKAAERDLGERVERHGSLTLGCSTCQRSPASGTVLPAGSTAAAGTR